MQFWGVEVKSGEPLLVECGNDFILRLSQISLGDSTKDKGNGPVCLYVKTDDKKLVLGTLSAEKVPQLSLDLVFCRDFELSHSGKSGSVYFIGYKVPQVEYEDSESEGEDIPAGFLNGAPSSRTGEVKPHKEEKEKPNSSGTKKVKIVEPVKDDTSDEETEDSSDEDDGKSDDDDKGKLTKAAGASDDEDDDEETDEEEEKDVTEKKLKKDSNGKKRSGPEAMTPAPNKKAKMVTPQKTGGKKPGEHQATPHPAKQAAKTPANKSHVCKSCNRSFGSDFALDSHSKAKHSAGK